ncbi:MAG: hypothetical protein ABIY55_27970 [Kofleriaceae bacterium]
MRTILLCCALTAALLPGCKKTDSCADLVQKVCAGGSLPCDKVTTWLDGEMTGPNHQKLSASEKSQACSAILGDKDALNGYIAGAKSALSK